ncbi:hypothetical protein EMCRGX_G010034 [Ephydatia muelleri]
MTTTPWSKLDSQSKEQLATSVEAALRYNKCKIPTNKRILQRIKAYYAMRRTSELAKADPVKLHERKLCMKRSRLTYVARDKAVKEAISKGTVQSGDMESITKIRDSVKPIPLENLTIEVADHEDGASKLQDDIRSSEHDLSSENLQEASHPSDALQEASHPSDALQDASHPSDALQDASHPSDALQEASHPSDALQEASHPSDALQDASHPSDALQEASHPSDTIPTEDLAAELLHSNDSCSPSISNSMADNIESSYETSAAIDPPCDSSNVTLTSFVPDVSEPPITSGLSNDSCLLQSHQF